MRRNPVSLEIGSVLLDGYTLSPHQSGQVRISLEQELTRLIHASGLPPQEAHLSAALAPQLPASSGAGPVDLGRQIARSVYAALNGKV